MRSTLIAPKTGSPHDREVTIAQRIRDRREALGITQDDLAAKTKISQATISEYERGKSKPSGERAFRLARALRVTADWLVLGGPEPEEGDTPPHWGEFLERYDHIGELSAEELTAMKRFAGRTHRIASWYDWVQLAEWLRNRQPSPTFEGVDGSGDNG